MFTNYLQKRTKAAKESQQRDIRADLRMSELRH